MTYMTNKGGEDIMMKFIALASLVAVVGFFVAQGVAFGQTETPTPTSSTTTMTPTPTTAVPSGAPATGFAPQ